MNPQTLQFIADGMLGLHIQIGEMNTLIGRLQTRINELEAANHVLVQKMRAMKGTPAQKEAPKKG